MASPTIAVERSGDVVWCALDRPPLNLFEPGLIASLRSTFDTLSRDVSIRAAVLVGRGRAFTAGMDVHVLHGLNATSARALITDLCGAIDAVHRAPFPVVAAIHGACLGAGFELALACDFRIAAADASFGLPEVRVGVPSVIQAALLPPLIGPGRAAEMLLLAERVDAARALTWGLVTRVVEPAALAAAVDETLAAVLACGPAAVRAQKALMIRWRESDLPSAIRAGIDAFAACYAGDEPREGAAAFLEKRSPRFAGRVMPSAGPGRETGTGR
jgi:enoyl-CoA hydratase